MNVWRGTDENAHLSNLSRRTLTGEDNREYVSVEHAYQTWKSGKFDKLTYHKHWKDGSKFRTHKGTRTDGDWNLNLMYRIMERSFIENPLAMASLLATGDEVITHVQDNGIWKEKFPQFLMKIRKTHRWKSLREHLRDEDTL